MTEPTFTQEQQVRADLLLELRKATYRMPLQDLYGQVVIWLHFTDWVNNFDLERLVSLGLLVQSSIFTYQPDGSWQDKFPPTAYHLSMNAKLMLIHSSQYVFEGTFTHEQESDYNAKALRNWYVRWSDNPSKFGGDHEQR